MATRHSPSFGAFKCNNPTLASPKFTDPRNIVNAPCTRPVVGEKLTFTVTSTVSVGSTGVLETAKFTVVQLAELTVIAVVVRVILTIPLLITIVAIWDNSRSPSLISNLLSAVLTLAARTEYM